MAVLGGSTRERRGQRTRTDCAAFLSSEVSVAEFPIGHVEYFRRVEGFRIHARKFLKNARLYETFDVTLCCRVT